MEENKGNKDQKKQSTGRTHKTGSKKKPGPSKTQSLAARVKKLEGMLEEEKNKYIRLSADFDNYRKRTLKEKMELTKLAGEEIFLRILPVLDDLERAMKSIQDASDIDAVKEGVKLIYNKFSDYLSQHGVKEIDAMNQEFDTDLHEAVSQVPAPDEKLKGKIIDVIEKGYLLNGKVIRYPKVVIGE